MKNKNIEEFLESYGLDINTLDSLSIRTNLSTSMKKDLNKFNKNEVIEDLKRVTKIYFTYDLNNQKYGHRVKSINSINRKFKRYYSSNRNFKKVFNDILGFRIIVNSYKEILKLNKNKFKLVDMSNGKKIDDGYRGIHIYYQKNIKYYPIEIQIMTYKDYVFNKFLHDYIYKKNLNTNIGKILKTIYDNGKIKNEKEFKEILKNVLYSCKRF